MLYLKAYTCRISFIATSPWLNIYTRPTGEDPVKVAKLFDGH